MSALLHAAIESNEHEGEHENNNAQNNEEISNNNAQNEINNELKEEINNEEKEEQDKNNSPVEWMKDEDSPNCTLCKKAFSLTFRRHHCRACGKIFCAKCSSLEALLPPQYHYQNGMERVCDECSYSQWPYHSEIANTEIGNIEYCKIGHGEKVILCIHGSFGDFSHSLALNYYFINDKEKLSEYTLISYSRPGYGKTKQDLSISTTSFESQAQIIFYLLKFLLISQQVHVIAYSTGGPIAIQFAGQFPSLVASITLISAITRKYWPGQAKGLSEDESPLKPLPNNIENNNNIDNNNGNNNGEENIDNIDNINNNNENINKVKEKPSITTKISKSFQSIGLWFAKKLVSNYPTGTKVMLKNLISESSLFDDSSIDRHVDRIIADPLLVWLFQAICLSMQNSDGLSVDMTAARNIEEWDVEGIEIPTLVIHGRNDGDVPITHAEEIVSKLPNAKLLSLDDTDHMVWLSSSRRAVEQYIVDFIHSPSSFISFDHHEDEGLSIGRSSYSESSNPIPIVDKEENIIDHSDQKFSLEEVDEKKVQHSNSLIGNKLVEKKIKKAAKEHQFLEEQMFDL